MVQLVGIVNITPDSFSDGGKYSEPVDAIARVEQLFSDGASIVDVGAESTRPNATPLTDDEEWRRLEPILRVIIPKYPSKLSIDTYHPETARRALAIGPVIINDVTGFSHPRMIDVVLKYKPTVIISHLPGNDIQQAHQQAPTSTVVEVRRALLATVTDLLQRGFPKENIILDPGIGFGKTMELNHILLKFGNEIADYPVMIGYSRKRFLGEDRMEIEPNRKAGQIAASHGATYLRVHDIAGHKNLLG